jgi:hypothetical protein
MFLHSFYTVVANSIISSGIMKPIWRFDNFKNENHRCLEWEFMRRWILFLVLASSLLAFASNARADEPAEYLLRVDLKGISLNGLMAQMDVLQDLGSCAIAKGENEDLKNLDRLGITYEVLETDPSQKEYFLVYQRDFKKLQSVDFLGDVLYADEARALVRTDQDNAVLIARLGFEIAKLFMDPMRPVSEFSALSVDAFTVHPEIQDMVDAVSQSNLEAIVQDLADAGGYGTRRSNTLGGHWAAQYIYDKFVSYGIADVSFHDFDINADNVVAVIPGAAFPENIFVLGGHYDSLALFSGSAPGADDNASGTAAVMEAARIMSGHPFENTVVFITFASEEFGLFGSNAYARAASQRGDNIVGMLNVDMIGYLASGDTPDVDVIAGSGSSGLRELAFWATQEYVPGFPAIEGTGMFGGTSDHVSFILYGYPAIWFFEDVQYSPYIHTANDTVGLSLNSFELATNCTKSILATLASLAEPLDDIAIGHTPLDDTDDTVNPYPVVAKVLSVEPLASGYPLVRYAINGGAFTDLSMTPTGNPDEYQADIPPRSLNTMVNYYIEAQDVLGYQDTSPAAAPAETYEFAVEKRQIGWGPAEMGASLIKGGTSHSMVTNYALVLLLPAALLLVWKRNDWNT